MTGPHCGTYDKSHFAGEARTDASDMRKMGQVKQVVLVACLAHLARIRGPHRLGVDDGGADHRITGRPVTNLGRAGSWSRRLLAVSLVTKYGRITAARVVEVIW